MAAPVDVNYVTARSGLLEAPSASRERQHILREPRPDNGYDAGVSLDIRARRHRPYE